MVEEYNLHLKNYNYIGDQYKQFLEALFINPSNDELDTIRADDARNTMVKTNIYRECPGEFELLKGLQNKNIMISYVVTNRHLITIQKHACCKLFEHIYESTLTQQIF